MELLHTAHVPAGDGPFPTVVAVHGWGASGHDLLGLAPLIQGGQALLLCPQGPVTVAVGPGMEGYGWFPLVPGQAPSAEEFSAGTEALRRFLDQTQEAYPVDPERLCLLGFSQGGALGYDLALRDPGRFRGLAALSSWFPEELAATIAPTTATEEFPVLILHGTEDPVLEVEKARASRDLLARYGAEVSYRELAMGHELKPEALHILQGWIAERLGDA